ncbi:hypothetical protein HispidOSU_010367 [Sigmodon hispidus]
MEFQNLAPRATSLGEVGGRQREVQCSPPVSRVQCEPDGAALLPRVTRAGADVCSRQPPLSHPARWITLRNRRSVGAAAGSGGLRASSQGGRAPRCCRRRGPWAESSRKAGPRREGHGDAVRDSRAAQGFPALLCGRLLPAMLDRAT